MIHHPAGSPQYTQVVESYDKQGSQRLFTRPWLGATFDSVQWLQSVVHFIEACIVIYYNTIALFGHRYGIVLSYILIAALSFICMCS